MLTSRLTFQKTATSPVSSGTASIATPATPCNLREEVLGECEAADRLWEEKPGRNLILLFDGTGNILGNEHDTNVVRLLRALCQDADPANGCVPQIVYYDPGVGSANDFPASTIASKLSHTSRKLAGLAFGSGAFENIAEAYVFLVQNYLEGDRIFLFGFSRGAFTARAVGGMVNMYGLVHTNALPLIRQMVTTYFAKPDDANRAGVTKSDFAQDIVTNFALGRRPLIHFTGVWDTVETIGSGFLGGVRITNAASVAEKRFVHVRHALALHEIRCKYSPRAYCPPSYSSEEKQSRSFEERWFPGAHSDIGGSYRHDGLAMHSLSWMVTEASIRGLRIDAGRIPAQNGNAVMHDQTYKNPYWVWTGLSPRQRSPEALLDDSALPFLGAYNIDREGAKSSFLHYLGWTLALVVALLGALEAYQATLACDFLRAPSWASVWPSFFQISAPWHEVLGASCPSGWVHRALAWDWWFIAAYVLWIPYPMTWALRRISARAIREGKGLTALQKDVQWLMLTLVVADVIENLGSYWIPEMGAHSAGIFTCVAAWTVALSSAVKTLALGMLLWVFLSGALCTLRANNQGER